MKSFGEHSENGVPDIFEAWNVAGLESPLIEECFNGDLPARTIVTLPLEKRKPSVSGKVAIKSSDKKAAISDKTKHHMQVIIEFMQEGEIKQALKTLVEEEAKSGQKALEKAWKFQ